MDLKLCGECEHWVRSRCYEQDALGVICGHCRKHNRTTSRVMNCIDNGAPGYAYCTAAVAELVKDHYNPETATRMEDADEIAHWEAMAEQKKQEMRDFISTANKKYAQMHSEWRKRTNYKWKEEKPMEQYIPHDGHTCAIKYSDSPSAIRSRRYYHAHREELLERRRSTRNKAFDLDGVTGDMVNVVNLKPKKKPYNNVAEAEKSREYYHNNREKIIARRHELAAEKKALKEKEANNDAN